MSGRKEREQQQRTAVERDGGTDGATAAARQGDASGIVVGVGGGGGRSGVHLVR